MKHYGRAMAWLHTRDGDLLRRTRSLQRPWLTSVMKVLSTLGNGAAWTATAATLMLLGGALASVGLRVGVAAVLALLISFPLKRICNRSRPSRALLGLLPLVKDPDRFSFPSGHTTAAFAVAITLAPVVPLFPVVVLGASAIGFSRIYLGAHFPLDVLAGAVIGSGVGLCTCSLFS